MEPTMEEKLNACIELCEASDPEMCAFLGKEFYYGWNVPQDLDRALRYLTVASENGDAISQFTLGFMYWSGRGTEPDQDKAQAMTEVTDIRTGIFMKPDAPQQCGAFSFTDKPAPGCGMLNKKKQATTKVAGSTL